ncbi:hypothetical protein LQE93_12060 [Clostridium sp. NSJ-145]|uniref:hypothetical protein n=1 Tax=Clostridium sp. NSJ-145 TaxID=2897777 RepID=UPI001E2A3446|nr:hypothetical protein [Clostridium sp. NSJ-145]MCD2502517.1 hypothetical protein [Clostridium sp. NSJ-145]MDY3362201.1 hypothetical protein [Clostridium celatum]
MFKKLINFFRQIVFVIKRKEAVCRNDEINTNVDIGKELELKSGIEVEDVEKGLEVTSSEKAVILTNGVAIGESFINDGTLNAVERSYLMIIIYKFDLTEGYSEVSISDFLKYTNTTNRGNAIKVIERLENKNVIKKIKGDSSECNRFLVLKHMLIITESAIKYETSNKNVTRDESIIQENEYKNISFKEINKDKELSSKYATKLLRDTCSKNIEELNRICEGYNELKIRADEFIEKIDN